MFVVCYVCLFYLILSFLLGVITRLLGWGGVFVVLLWFMYSITLCCCFVVLCLRCFVVMCGFGIGLGVVCLGGGCCYVILFFGVCLFCFVCLWYGFVLLVVVLVVVVICLFFYVFSLLRGCGGFGVWVGSVWCLGFGVVFVVWGGVCGVCGVCGVADLVVDFGVLVWWWVWVGWLGLCLLFLGCLSCGFLC